MLILLFVLIVCLLLYYYVGRYYTRGMAEYARYNNTFPPSEYNHNTHAESCYDSIRTEFGECLEEVYAFNLWPAFMELCDVLHASYKYIAVSYLPPRVITCEYVWIPSFFLIMPATIKLGLRYKHNGCIRNHSNPNNRNHTCRKNKKLHSESQQSEQ